MYYFARYTVRELKSFFHSHACCLSLETEKEEHCLSSHLGRPRRRKLKTIKVREDRMDAVKGPKGRRSKGKERGQREEEEEGS